VTQQHDALLHYGGYHLKDRQCRCSISPSCLHGRSQRWHPHDKHLTSKVRCTSCRQQPSEVRHQILVTKIAHVAPFLLSEHAALSSTALSTNVSVVSRCGRRSPAVVSLHIYLHISLLISNALSGCAYMSYREPRFQLCRDT
jgi:hypothetical protein